MENINFDEGRISLSINKDENRVISFSPTDNAMLDRICKGLENIQNSMENVSKNEEIQNANVKIQNGEDPQELFELTKNAASTIVDIDQVIRDQIDYMFDGPVSKVVFGNTSPSSLVDGIPFYERFLNAVTPFIESKIKETVKKSERLVEKYNAKKKFIK